MLALHWLSFYCSRHLTAPKSSEQHFAELKNSLYNAACRTKDISHTEIRPESVSQLLDLLEVVRSELGKIDSAANLFARESKTSNKKVFQFKKSPKALPESAAFRIARRLLREGQSIEAVSKKTLLPLETVSLLVPPETNTPPASAPKDAISIAIEREETLL